ncbi:universal stress protein [Halobium salinum]|uniref:Universal stress protein n=1 Tax=Halobium salinum TaxID=1364940 RepID=A0ABD5PFI4_9EURY|nr:universal stress protein [Halobium salinum]
MYDRIMVATDGSEVADAAVDAAVALAKRVDADLHAVHVLELGDLPPSAEEGEVEERRRRGEEAVAAVGERAEAAGLEPTTALLDGGDPVPVHRSLLDYADEHGVDCIVMGTQGHTGWERFVLGSVAERTLRESPVPVLTVHEDTPFGPAPAAGSTWEGYPGATLDRLLVPVDGSDGSAAAVDHAIDVANATGADLHLLHVVDVSVAATGNAGLVLKRLEEAGERVLGEAVAKAKDAGLSEDRVGTSIVRGAPYQSIVDYASDHEVDCIVMGTHGRTGLKRYLLGSVTERTVRLADRPVLSVGAPLDGE